MTRIFHRCLPRPAHRYAAALLAAVMVSPALAATPATDAAAGQSGLADARSLLEAIDYPALMRQILQLTAGQGPSGPDDSRSEAERELVRRWTAAMPMAPFVDGAASRLAAASSAAELAQGVAYFRSDAGRTELACIRAALGTPGVPDCIRERGGEAQYQAHRAFAETSIEDKLGDVMASGASEEDFRTAARLAVENDPALAKDAAAHCERNPGGLCDALESAPAKP
ncbi:hypothetical protein K4L06_19800 [Lysobacter sp. BMK333-48F3]|uniref:hypothetical protein n=1 Tax=Lysobacter sp. BMK333-48F3 TaxID=2867962 RepID=UPI001C8C0C5A|nr:hypothetical protein [Lysobacter sp. BMK333-48F3]MBX9403558.1 hypothetical protein [Lysobacter sp. BMK333-48F3]